MAERRRQFKMRCQIHFLPDRHVPQKMSQVYHWLVPETSDEAGQQSAHLSETPRAKDHRHLRPSFF
jgi:hypothetical protein